MTIEPTDKRDFLRKDVHLLAKEANRIRGAVIEDFKNNRLSFDDVLLYAETNKPIARMQMTRLLRAYGWKKRQFMVAINVLNLPVNNRLEWWVNPKRKEELEKLRNYMTSGALRANVPDGFPWSENPM